MVVEMLKFSKVGRVTTCKNHYDIRELNESCICLICEVRV